jgi:hypothetical protein
MFGDNLAALQVLVEAIGRGVCVTAVYNRGNITLAPESLTERHGELYLRAVRVEYDGRQPRQLKLGTFKLSGLSSLGLTDRACLAKELLTEAEG